jgi:pyruvate dehydrogenase E2 component (dihydrolipoyllysine-residue acetyltransferase)
MPSLLRMPEVATDTPEATLVAWSVSENVPYAAHDAIVTVETSKAVVDVEAESDGVIFKTLVAQGADVKVGEPIAVIGTPGESIRDLAAVLVELGVGPSGAEDGLAEPPGPNAVAPQQAPAPTVGQQGMSRIIISPLARRLAREAGLDIAEIRGSGPASRIVRRDVEGAIARRPNGGLPAFAPSSPAAGPDGAGSSGEAQAPKTQPSGSFHDTPHTRARRTIAARLTESTQTAPHFYLSAVPRVDRLLRLRRRMNLDAAVRVSVNDLVIKAVARAHEMVPAMNVIWTADAVRSFAEVDVAVAVATESGLVTPVVRDAGALSVSAIAAISQDFVQRARAGRLQLDELAGGSITVTNLGMFGTREFAAIINPPHAAILAVGAAVEQPIVKKSRVSVGTVMHVTLSVDHRPVDGAVAAAWMQAFVSLIENPVRILV